VTPVRRVAAKGKVVERKVGWSGDKGGARVANDVVCVGRRTPPPPGGLNRLIKKPLGEGSLGSKLDGGSLWQ